MSLRNETSQDLDSDIEKAKQYNQQVGTSGQIDMLNSSRYANYSGHSHDGDIEKAKAYNELVNASRQADTINSATSSTGLE
ncbi:hypothetical protein [Clostridium beijerinckii]|uniref:Uncharacterized protein n=1 Tax=Clostridium beijerinckii TaxID=1520 RepID=A0A1S9N4V1_CLOBE|nr:hypothetical protein [Clostridium beijerinckii]MZK51093.1 hypothetical protein [Clostridium beijerinckii]MZK59295.1 hypothetical protein [Clostridium beijerinckii]MZK69414.1 hypothetical protein [Clostridium beijerinckii]MZK74787.1 hypothetical protein [Clostridium beijerinckii]MZK84505.1 hypothetical protein [Clostridium beijerinckii]